MRHAAVLVVVMTLAGRLAADATDARQLAAKDALASGARSSVVDFEHLAELLRADRPVVLDVPGKVTLSGDWTLPSGSLVIRARGGLVARAFHLTAPGLRLTVEAPTLRLVEGSRLDLGAPAGRGGSLALDAHDRGAGELELSADSAIDVSGGSGLGGEIALAADAVHSAGSLLARGQGRIAVEARHAFTFTGPADTAGGLIRLDPSNMVIGATDASVNSGTSGSFITRSPAADTGELAATTLVALLATNDVIVHTLSTGSATGITLPAGFTAMDAVGGDIDVQAAVTWTSDHSLWLLAHDDLIVRASVQRDGATAAGSVVGVAGWDGSFGAFSTDPLDPSTSTSYGNGNGDVFVLGPAGASAGVAFGDRLGTTVVAGRDVRVLGSTDAVVSNNAFAQIGYRLSAAGTDPTTIGAVSGEIRVRARGAVQVLGGVEPGSLRWAQIGNGGGLDNNVLGNLQGDLGGNVSVLANGAVDVISGTRQAYAHIGNGGCANSGSKRGNLTGNIEVRGSAVQVRNANGTSVLTYAMIGNGGQEVFGPGVTGTVAGDIHVQTTSGDLQILPTAASPGTANAQIGNGGLLNGAIGSARATYGAISGSITVDVAQDLIQEGGRAQNSSSQIGHGGYILSSGVFGPITGDIAVTVDRDALLGSSTVSPGNPRPAQIGHGGGTRAIFVVPGADTAERQAITGAIELRVVRELRLLPGSTDLAYTQIGHGGMLFVQPGASAVEASLQSASGDITVEASSIELRGGVGSLSYAQIGNGAASVLLGASAEAHEGPTSGAIAVTTTGATCRPALPPAPLLPLPCGDLALVGGPTSTGGSYAWIGNGGEPYDNGVSKLGTQVGASGNVTVVVAKETSLVNGPTDFWHIGHIVLQQSPPAVPVAPTIAGAVSLTTGTLDFDATLTSASATVDDVRFWPQYVFESPNIYLDNVTGGAVTLRVRGTGADGSLVIQQPLSLPAGVANPVKLASSDDLTVDAAIGNAGSSVVDLIADDANPARPAKSSSAVFTIGAGGSIAGDVRLFAVDPSPSQFVPGSYVAPDTLYDIWYGEPGAVVGVNFKSLPPSADLTVTKGDSPDPVDAGSNLVYTVQVSNAGPGPAVSASLADALPAGTTFVSAVASGAWSCGGVAVGSNGTLTCTDAALAVGTTTITLTVHVDPSVAAGTVLSNTAALTTATPDPNPGDESATATTTVAASADVSTTKTDTPDPVNAGENLTYTITVANGGPSNAAAAALSDTTPAGTAFVSLSSPGGWSCTTPAVGSGGTISCTNASLAPGSSVFTLVLHVDASVAAGTVLSNTATASSATTDPSPGNESATETSTVSAAADLSVTKLDTPDPVTAGGNLTCTITAANAGPSNAVAVALDDTLPVGTTFLSLSSPGGWSCTTPAVGANGNVHCTRASFAAGNAVFTLVLAVSGATADGTVLSNTATVSAATGDPNTGNESATATTTVRALRYFTVAPCRLVDTRGAAGPNGGPALGASEARSFVLAGACAVPATARAVQLNVTAVDPAAGGNLRVYSADLALPPTTLVVGFNAGRTRASNVVVELGAAGDVVVDNASAGQTHLILDVSGYFE